VVDGDTYHVDRVGTIVSRHLAAPDAALRESEVRAVADLARKAARLFGSPQDIEWAFESGELYLLQSRPVSSLSHTPDADGVLRIWDNSNIVESYSGATTPLTFSFARDAYEGVYRQFCRIMRVPDATVAEHEDVFRNMLGLIKGRVYYNLVNWYRVVALLPGFRSNRRFMEQMMGVRDKLPETVLTSHDAASRGTRLRDTLRLGRTIAGLALAYATLSRRTAAFYARVDAVLAPADPPLEGRRADDLAAYYVSLRRQLLTKWDAPILNDFFTMIFHGLLRDVLARWCRDSGALANALIAGERGMVSTQPARRVQQLAELASRSPSFTEQLLHGSVDEILPAAREVPGFLSQYETYLLIFGERCSDELKLESATLIDDPLPLLRAVGQLASRRHATASGSSGPDAASVRADAEHRVMQTLRRRPFRRAIFKWILTNARARVRDRENLRYVRTRLFGRVRRTFVELGLRLNEGGFLDDPRDIFFLQVEEILGFVDGRAVTTDVKSLVALRQTEFTGHERGKAPASRFETRGVVYQGNAFCGGLSNSATAVAETLSERRGLGCCAGVRRGPVRVVRDPSSASLPPDSILVAERTDPGWIMIFPAAAGLIVERGSLLSHSAIVARELGIPSIVSVAGVTSWLRDGDWVEMDGSTGIVRKLAA
jgi:pyruvate,water dikinase